MSGKIFIQLLFENFIGIIIVQSDADILSQMSDSVQVVQCARNVMGLIAEIGASLEYE